MLLPTVTASSHDSGLAGQPVQRPFSVTHDSHAVFSQWDEPLHDLPATVKVDGKDMTLYHKLNIARSRLIAQQYDAMSHTPDDSFVLSAYHALCNETMAQWQLIKQAGLRVEFSPAEQPYPSPRKAILDITQNNHFFVTPTRSAFGTSNVIDPNDTNPLLAETSDVISGQPALVNDIFRIVHDFFGHVKEGLGFRVASEENAWRGHAVMYSPLARRALATELRGQNCWVNWGPYGEKNRTAGMDDTAFADLKIGLTEE